MGYGIEFLVALIILMNGARTDLLDVLSTGAYWRAKQVTVTVEQLERDAGPDERLLTIDALVEDLGAAEFKTRVRAKEKLAGMGPSILPQLQGALASKNPEVRAVAGEIARQFESKAKERTVRRLMAIRTLGERREKEALPLLRLMEESKEMFVAEYAQRAVAQIEGRPWEAPDRSGAIKNDYLLLPRHTGMVGQTTGLTAVPVTLDRLFGMVPGMAAAAGGGMPSREEAVGKATAAMLPLLERIGNVRIDGLTAALSEDAGETTGWELTIIRGQFDANALQGAARQLSHPADGVVKYGSEHGIPIVQTDVDTHVMFPSDQMIILVMADEEKDRFARMLAMVYALETGHGSISRNRELNGLIGKVDTASPLWLVGTFNPEEKKAKLLAGVDSFTLTGVRKKESLALTLRTEGADAEALKGSVDELNADMQMLQQVIPQVATLAPIAEFVRGVHGAVEEGGKRASATAELKTGVTASVLANALPELDLVKVPDQPQQTPNGPVPNQPVVAPGQ